MRRQGRDTQLTNEELASIYDYLNGNIGAIQLKKEVKRSRTNTYYYIGRAVDYWLQIGVLQFVEVTSQAELGGKEKNNEEDA